MGGSFKEVAFAVFDAALLRDRTTCEVAQTVLERFIQEITVMCNTYLPLSTAKIEVIFPTVQL